MPVSLKVLGKRIPVCTETLGKHSIACSPKNTTGSFVTFHIQEDSLNVVLDMPAFVDCLAVALETQSKGTLVGHCVLIYGSSHIQSLAEKVRALNQRIPIQTDNKPERSIE